VDIRGIDGLSCSGRALYERTRRIIPYLSYDITLSDYFERIVSELLGSKSVNELRLTEYVSNEAYSS